MCFNFLKNLFGINNDNEQEDSSSCSSESSDTVNVGVKKRALCFGINDYPGTGNDLRGCLNDVADWSSLLKDIYKFDEVVNMKDASCTKNNIKAAILKLIEVSIPGDVLVIQYSGHGTYTTDQNGDEIDNKDEAIVMYDGLLIDDDIREIMAQIKDGVKTTIIFDSCFSGTATRAFNFNDEGFYRVSRFMPTKENGKMACAKIGKRIFKSIEEKDMKEILISGCSESEVSYDAQFDGKYYGAMSYWATRVLKANPNITYSEFHAKLREKLPSSQYPQSPQLEGSAKDKSRLVFS